MFVAAIFILQSVIRQLATRSRAFKRAADKFYEQAEELMNYDGVPEEVLSAIEFHSKRSIFDWLPNLRAA